MRTILSLVLASVLLLGAVGTTKANGVTFFAAGDPGCGSVVTPSVAFFQPAFVQSAFLPAFHTAFLQRNLFGFHVGVGRFIGANIHVGNRAVGNNFIRGRNVNHNRQFIR